MHRRIAVKDGVFAVIGGNPYKIIDIGIGGASFHCSDVHFDDDNKQGMEILVMNGDINYIHEIKHSIIKSKTSAEDRINGEISNRVCVEFRNLTMHQSAQFQMLLGVS